MPIVNATTNLGWMGAKYARDDNTIVYSQELSRNHANIAAEENIGESIEPPEGDFRMLVDDAGFMGQEASGSLVFSGSSTTCKLRDPSTAKKVTLEVASRITGKPAKEGDY